MAEEVSHIWQLSAVQVAVQSFEPPSMNPTMQVEQVDKVAHVAQFSPQILHAEVSQKEFPEQQLVPELQVAH